MKKVLIASKNKGKVEIYRPLFNKLNIEVLTLNDIDERIESPEENGKKVIDNAIIKARFYNNLTGLPTFANDSGLIIKKLSSQEQAGMFVRRVNGKELTDQEMIERYIEKINTIGGSSLAYWDVGLAIVDSSGKVYKKRFKVKFALVNTPSKIIIPGIPLDSISYDKKLKKCKSELTAEYRTISEGSSDKKAEKFIRKVFK